MEGLNADTCSGMINEECTDMRGSIGHNISDVGFPLTSAPVLLRRVEEFRVEATRKLDPARRVELGQFLTPTPIAKFMASMCEAKSRSIRILDAGAGVGSLTAAVVAELCTRQRHPLRMSVSAYELDRALVTYLNQTMSLCKQLCAQVGIHFESEINSVDFIQSVGSTLSAPLFEEPGRFDLAILNPPYRKINSDSDIRQVLRSAGIETSNLYTGFVSLVTRMLTNGGELVAITPRSFCNGPYFRPFREDFLSRMEFKRLHVFESRNVAFCDDDVLQENIIFRALRGPGSTSTVALSMSVHPNEESVTVRQVKPEELVHPGDPELFIHIVSDEVNQRVAQRMAALSCTLPDLELSVSTGRVVDFRAKRFLRSDPQDDCAPLIYPCHFKDGLVAWPKLNGKKPNAIAISPETRDTLVPKGVYVLTKRFSAKEEPRRVVAALYDPTLVSEPLVGFENHLNYYHQGGNGLPMDLARGLVAYLNSTFVDTYFRQFNGHTQVNATDLRNLKYPPQASLEAFGSSIRYGFPPQVELDGLVERELIDKPADGFSYPTLA
ncbi:MAG: N-6 DNA methylase [Terriglobia bacterium]|jgi:adenine-specific DNA-methyltransferase